MTPSERRAALRRRKDYFLGLALLGGLGALVNPQNGFAYLSLVPDSIREYSAVPDFASKVRDWTRGNVWRNGGDIPRLLFLIQNAMRLVDEGVPGDFAELGVHKGHSARVLADVLAARGSKRRLFLFDTFAGFDERDLEGVDADQPALFADSSLAEVRRSVGNDSICEYHPGYFPDSAGALDPEVTFALVHLDCDLYEPTRAALELFYPRLTSGALVIVHDYSSGHWPGVPKAVKEFLIDKPEHVMVLPDKCGTAVFIKT